MRTIRDMRLDAGLTQQEFATFIHCKIRNIQSCEQGINGTPEYVLFLVEQFLITNGYIEWL